MSDFYQGEFPNYWDILKPKITLVELRSINSTEEELINYFGEYPMSFFSSMYDTKPEFNSTLKGYFYAVRGDSTNVDIFVDDRIRTKKITKKNGDTFYIDEYPRAYMTRPDVPATDHFENNVKKVLKARTLRSGKDKKGYKRQKSLSISVSCSAIYKENTPDKSAKNIAHRNHLIFIDIDLDDSYDLVAIYESLKGDKYTKMVHLSFSGDGFVVVVEMSENDTYNNFKLVFIKLEKYYKKTYNLTIDQSCSNIGRLRYISYDPFVFIKQNILVEITQEEFDEETKKRELHVQKILSKQIFYNEKQKQTSHTNLKSVSDLVDEAISTVYQFTDGYDNWLRISFSMHEYPFEFQRLNDHWNKGHRRWTALNNANSNSTGEIGIGTFYYYCKEAGISITPRIKKEPKIKIQQSSSENLNFLFN